MMAHGISLTICYAARSHREHEQAIEHVKEI